MYLIAHSTSPLTDTHMDCESSIWRCTADERLLSLHNTFYNSDDKLQTQLLRVIKMIHGENDPI